MSGEPKGVPISCEMARRLIEAAFTHARKAEREACAEMVERFFLDSKDAGPLARADAVILAQSIRARRGGA